MRTLLVAILLAAPLSADVFVLADGRRIEGKLARETSGSYFVETGIGELELRKSEVVERIVKKTARELYDERIAAAKTADDFHAAGALAAEAKLKSLATKAWRRALELEPQHARANEALGNVLYKGVWMTPDERDRRLAADEEAEMLRRGLVRWKERWVTPEERAQLERGLVLRDGRWMTEAESKRLDGLEEFGGAWYPRAEALARADVAAVEKLAGRPLQLVISPQAALAGDWGESVLAATAAHVQTAREWFDRAYQVEPGLALLGNRLAEFYLWNRDDAPYVGTVDHFASLTRTVPEGWAAVVKQRHGFFWIDPYALSSARVWHRPDDDLVGHCIHHWGHMLLGRLGYDGRLLPPWYDEGLASLTEFKIFGRNAVFCRSASSTVATKGSSAKKGALTFQFDAGLFREGAWTDTLRKALAAGAVPSFDRLASLDIGQLELLDIACGMAITWWLEELAPDALPRFHAEIRKLQPRAPERLLSEARERQAQYDAAFAAAAGIGWREADQAWRAWFAGR
jgi:hypothetical protein